MPIRIFWSMASHVERLKAADNLALLDVMAASQATADSQNRFREDLRERVGSVSRIEKPPSSKDEILAVIMPVGE